jgi:hypothetical protein
MRELKNISSPWESKTIVSSSRIYILSSPSGAVMWMQAGEALKV